MQTDFHLSIFFLFLQLTMLCVVEHTPLTIFQELELDHQIGKGEMDLKLLQIQSISMQRYQAYAP